MAIALIVNLLLTLSVLVYVRRPATLPDVLEAPHVVIPPAHVEIVVKGAVANPGTYHLAKGASIKELLDVVQPLPSADLRVFAKKKRLQRNQQFFIPEMKYITIYVSGAVSQAGPILLPDGSTIGNLLKKVSLTPKASLKSLRKRRILTDQEKVVIPSRKTKSQATHSK